MTWVHGQHSFKFGFDGRRIEATLTNPDQTPRGDYQYSAAQTSNSGVGGDGFASLLLGFPDVVSRGFVLTRPYVWSSEGGAYGQDNWRVSAGVTLNLGLRWEWLTLYTDKYNRESNFFISGPAAGRVVLATPTVRVPGVTEEKGDFSPRIGIAYNPDHSGKLVLRAGISVGYFSQGGAMYGGTLERNFPYFQTINYTDPYQFAPFWQVSSTNVGGTSYTAQGVPAGNYGDYPYQNVILPPTAGKSFTTMTPPTGVAPYYVPANERPTRVPEWNVGVQRAIGKNGAAEIDYVGTTASFIEYSYNIDVPKAPSTSFVEADLPYYNIAPQLNNISAVTTDRSSRYESLQASYNHRYSNGMQALLAYTWAASKADTGAGQFFFPWNDSLNWGPNSYRHRFTGSWSYDLPFGQGRPFMSGASGLKEAVAGGWSVSGIATLHTGSPLSVASLNNTLNLPGIGNRANKTCPKVKYPKTAKQWFNTSCFADPAPQTFGNARNGAIWGPGETNFDMSAIKTFKTERFTTALSGDFFNAFNNHHWANPNTNFGSGSFGEITSSALTAREIQVGLKLLF